MSEPFDQQKRTVITAFNNVVRQSSLAGAVELQRLVIAIDQLLTRAGPGAPLDLAPVRHLLLDLKASEDAIAEAFLALKSRADSLGVPVVLPPEVEGLPDAKKQRLLDAYHKRAQPAGERREKKPAEPAHPSPDAPASRRPAKASGGGANRGLIAALVVVVIAGVGITVYSSQTAPAGPQPVSVSVPDGLTCVALEANHGTAVCRMTTQSFEALSADERQQRAQATKKALQAKGVQRLLLQTVEDRRYRGTY